MLQFLSIRSLRILRFNEAAGADPADAELIKGLGGSS